MMKKVDIPNDNNSKPNMTDNDLINFEYLHAKIKHLSEPQVKKSLQIIKTMSLEPIDIKKMAFHLYLGLTEEMV